MFLQRRFGYEGVEEVLAALGILSGVRLSAGLVEMRSPILVELAEDLELLRKIQGLAGVVVDVAGCSRFALFRFQALIGGGLGGFAI
jgi:hypothetical protein